MARLFVQSGRSMGTELELSGPVVAGRLTTCDLPLREGQASRRHFEVEQVGGRWFLTDLGSRNGTLLNGSPVQGRVEIEPGDEIQVGATVVVLVADGGKTGGAGRGPEATDALAPGTTLGAYRIDSLERKTESGTLYRATQHSLERPVFLEVLDADASRTVRRSFEDRARAASRWEHESLLSVLDFGESDGRFFRVAEHFAGRRLASLLERGSPLPLGTALSVLRQVAEAAAHVHARGAALGMLWPPAVLVDPRRWRVKVHPLEEPVAEPFLAPELEEDAPPTVAGDRFALGALAFTLLAGKEPEAGADLSEANPALPAAITEAVAVLLSPTDRDRPPVGESAKVFAQDIQSEPAPKPKRKRPSGPDHDAPGAEPSPDSGRKRRGKRPSDREPAPPAGPDAAQGPAEPAPAQAGNDVLHYLLLAIFYALLFYASSRATLILLRFLG